MSFCSLEGKKKLQMNNQKTKPNQTKKPNQPTNQPTNQPLKRNRIYYWLMRPV